MPLIDDFNRADAVPPLGGDWSPCTTNGCCVSSNRVSACTPFGFAIWQGEEFPANQYVKVKVPVTFGDTTQTIRLFCRVQGTFGATSDYTDIVSGVMLTLDPVDGDPGGAVTYTISTFTGVAVASGTSYLANDDTIELRCIGTQLTALRNDVEVVTLNEVASVDTGFVGMHFKAGYELDDFEGGEYVIDASTNALPFTDLVKLIGAPKCKGNSWYIVNPVATTNIVLNPSAEIEGNFEAVGNATVVRYGSGGSSHYGVYSYDVACLGVGDGIKLTIQPSEDTVHFLTFRIKQATVIPNLNVKLTNSQNKRVQFIERINSEWYLFGMVFTSSEVNGSTDLYITQIGAGGSEFYIDGVQLEPHEYWTTYCDGTQEGCSWDGIYHGSTSSRSEFSRAGGRVQDFYDVYKFLIKRAVGVGAAPTLVKLEPYALLPGSALASVSIDSRDFTLIGDFYADTESELHRNRQALLLALDNDKYSADQPVRLIFAGAEAQKEISVYYKGGLEEDLAAFYGGYELSDGKWTRLNKYMDKAAIQFSAPDPFWYGVGEAAYMLDAYMLGGFRIAAMRKVIQGNSNVYDVLGSTTALGTYNHVYAFAEDEQYIYIGGDFSNYTNIANADNIVRMNKATKVLSALGTGCNGVVRALAIAPNGNLYAAGDFTLAGGVADTAHIAEWDGTDWIPLSTGTNGNVYSIAIGALGVLYAAGAFTLAGGVADTVRIAEWDGANWSALSTGANGDILDMAIGPDNILYVCGSFTTIGGVSAARIASWNGSAFSALGSGSASTVQALAIGSDNILYVGGTFTSIGGVSAARIASWNGSAFSALGSGLDGNVADISIGPDGAVYVVGAFVGAGTLDIADRIAVWNDYTWHYVDINLPGAGGVKCVYTSKLTDAVLKKHYTILYGFSDAGNATMAIAYNVLYTGSAIAHPKIIFTRGSAVGLLTTIRSIRNETTGQFLMLDYDLADGEVLTLDLTPSKKSVLSSFYGTRHNAVLPGSDFGTWGLKNGYNMISTYIRLEDSDVNSTTVHLLWRNVYKSWD